jgi:uroporphyrinogen decarboxylase
VVRVPPVVAAYRGEAVEAVPVWFMRQAGRSLPEYRAVRERYSFTEVVRRPELAAEVTLQPVRRLGVDAAILFSDIVTPLQAVVQGISIEADVGPMVDQPFRTKGDLARLRPLEPEEDVPYVLETVRLVRGELGPEVALVGFAGAPFTLASYLVEGGKSSDYRHTLALMHGEPDVWGDLLDRLAGITLASLRAQVAAGAQAVQLFDSWVGTLTEAEYRRHVLPASRRVLAGLADLDVPRVHFGVGAGHLLEAMAEAGADVVGVDWRTSLDGARRRLGPGVAVQGNLDPAALSAPTQVLDAAVAAVLADNAGRPGHVFNLGWGVPPETDPATLARVVDLVHACPLPTPPLSPPTSASGSGSAAVTATLPRPERGEA